MTNRPRPVRNGTVLTALLAVLSLAYFGAVAPLAAQVTVSNTGSSGTSGFNANEGTPISSCNGGTGCGSVHTDSMWADNSIHRWVMSNNGGTNVLVSAWPCSSQGCIPMSGAVNASYYPENTLVFPSGGPGLPLISGTPSSGLGYPEWGGGPGLNANQTFALDLPTGTYSLALATEVVNDTTTGTNQNYLAKIVAPSSGSWATAIQITTSDPSSLSTYIVAYDPPGTGGGKTGNAQLAVNGQAYCYMDASASNTAGLFVVASTGTNAQCSTTSNPAFGTWIVGTMISSSTVVNNTALILVHPGYRAFGSITGLSYASGTYLATTPAPSGLTSGHLASWDTNKNANDSGVVANNVLTFNAPATGTILSGNGTQTPNAIATGTYGFPLASAGSSAQPSYQRQIITSIPSGDTISGAATFTTTLSIPGGVLAIGSVIEVRAHGVFTNTASTQNFALQVNAGGETGVCPASSSNLQPAVNTDGYWDATCFIQVTATGNPGSAITWGQFTMASTNGSAVLFRMFSNATATGDVNFITTAAENVSLQATTMTGSGMTLTCPATTGPVVVTTPTETLTSNHNLQIVQ